MNTIRPTLVIMAAGMGNRYGGLKQLDGIGPSGETIMDYSVYNALRAGFGKVVFVIRRSFESEFRQKVLAKYSHLVTTEVVFQEIDKLPATFVPPAERTKPWGTNHALLMAASAVQEPFCVINADDYYGGEAFHLMANAFIGLPRGSRGHYFMIAYELGKTLSESGTVSRGICRLTPDGYLASIQERKRLHAEGSEVVDDDTQDRYPLKTPVSMNFWGFTPDYFAHSEELLKQFLTERGGDRDAEFYIPSAVDTLLRRGDACVEVLTSTEEWMGVTYPADREPVAGGLLFLHQRAIYPTPLFQK